MAATARKRHDPRRDATRIALIEAAESLIAEAGVEGVSTRQIGAAIGSLNTNVVAYHFGSKEALIEAVYRHRLPGIDRRRRELLDQAEAEGRADDPRELMRAFALPLFEQTDAEGRHGFARFLAAVERAGLMATRGQVRVDFPETDRLVARMASLLPPEVAPLVQDRLRIVVSLIQSTLQLIDSEARNDPARARRLFDDAVAMASAAICAPVPTSGESQR